MNLDNAALVLERARTESGISKREASRRAGLSEARWRQVIQACEGQTDVASLADSPVPIGTLLQMAIAVEVDSGDLVAAINMSADGLDRLVEEARNRIAAKQAAAAETVGRSGKGDAELLYRFDESRFSPEEIEELKYVALEAVKRRQREIERDRP